MTDKLIMNKEERKRKSLLDQVLALKLSKQDARHRLGISSRQFRRLLKSYQAHGDVALVHKHRGVSSGRAYPADFKSTVLGCYREYYLDYGPTLASEKLLEENNLRIHPETLRLWLKSAGLWLPRRQRKVHRKQRVRRSRFGELLQLDGSIHAWLPGVEGKQCLMNMVDDATGKTLALLDTGETTHAALALLKWWITEAGIPMAIYVDLKSVYVSPKTLKQEIDETTVEPGWLTHFSKACQALGIEIIKAYSPQAKGRVERSHAVYQDRLVKELALKKINTIEQANALLSDGFINKLNEKFAKSPRDEQDAHVELTGEEDLDQVLCWSYQRQIRNDWTIQFHKQCYQIEQSAQLSPKQKISVRCHLDGTQSYWYGDQELMVTRIEEKPIVPEKPRKAFSTQARSVHAKRNKHKTPWSQFNPSWLGSKTKKLADTYPQAPPSA